MFRRIGAVLGLVAACGVATPAGEDPPADESVRPVVVSAAAKISRGVSSSNVVPTTFRAQLVIDNRFKGVVKDADGSESPDPRNRTGKLHCLVCEYGLSPVVAVFVGDRADLAAADAANLAKLIERTNLLIPKYRADKLSAFVMFLKLEPGTKVVVVKKPDGSEEKVVADLEYPDDENREAKAVAVKAFAAPVGADNVPVGLAPVKSTASAAFGVAEDVPVTVVIYNRMRVVQRWELKLDQLDEGKIDEILAATETMIKGRRPKKD